MSCIVTSAPGKLILFGEHAVVYGKLGIVASIDRRCFVTIAPRDSGLRIKSKNYGVERVLDEKELKEFYFNTKSLVDAKSYEALTKLSQDCLAAPLYVITQLAVKHGFKPAEIEIVSELRRGLGSSSACFAALALAYSTYLGVKYDLEGISKLAFEGDILAHGGTPSGIDNTIATYGGFLTFRKTEGAKPLNLDYRPNLVVIDSGEVARTSETVSYIRELREKERKLVDGIMEDLEAIALDALDALVRADLAKLGKLMIAYYTTLSKLNISTRKLDEIVELSLKLGALGAKPTGGWGGGCCIALAKDEAHAKELAHRIKEAGFDAFTTSLGGPGVRLEEQQHSR